MAETTLGFGMMRLPRLDPNNPADIDFELTKKMVDAFMEQGFNYFDTAWVYCGGKSEAAVKEVLTSRYPRERYSLTSKLPSFKIKTPEDRDAVFNKQLERTGVDWFDVYLLHNVNTGSLRVFDGMDCFTWLKEKKAQGLAKKIGFSYHDGPELLDKLLTAHPEIDVVQLQLNYLDWNSAGVQSRACYEVAVKHGKDVYVMEPVKGGALVDIPAEAEALFKAHAPERSVPSWAIRFAATPENVKIVLSGMNTMDQLEDNMSSLKDFVPLTAEEQNIAAQAAAIIFKDIAIPCTACDYCMEDCPQNISISKYFALYNADQKQNKDLGWSPQDLYYNSLKRSFGGPKDCVECGQCEEACPQKLPIREHLKTVADHFEKK